MRVGVLSDTHIGAGSRRVIPAAVWHALLGVECILHGGDVACRDVLDELAAIAPVHAVYGNIDPPELARTLPAALELDLGGARIGLTHGHLGRGHSTPERALSMFHGAEVFCAVVFGHSHEPYNRVERGVLLFNPGSPTERRRQPRHSFGLLHIESGAVRGEIVYL